MFISQFFRGCHPMYTWAAANRRRAYLFVGVITLLALSNRSAQAAYIIDVNVQSETVTAGSSGVFDITFTNVSGNPPELAGFQVVLNMMPTNGSILLGTPEVPDATPPAALTPALPDSGFQLGPYSATGFSVSNYLSGGSTDPIISGDGLVRVPFTTDVSASGVYNLILDPDNTILSDATGLMPISYTPVNGSITITPAPEPAGVSLYAAFAVLAAVRRPCRKQV